jgi:hypothetical protein
LPQNNDLFARDPLLAEHSRPKREIVDKQRLANPEPRGRPRKRSHQAAQLTNWQAPLLWGPIQQAVKAVGWSASAIRDWLKKHNTSHYGHIQANVIRRWITQDANGKRGWSENTLARAAQAHTPGGQTTRAGLLVRRLLNRHTFAFSYNPVQDKCPLLLQEIILQLKLLRATGVGINIYTTRGLMLGHIEHFAPELLLVRLADGSTFSCSDLYVRKFLKRHLNFVPRVATRAAQKIPVNWEDLIRRAVLRLVQSIRKRKVPPELMVNWDQTQVRVQMSSNSTFEESGSKQISVLGKEEKRAWTALVSVAADGTALPLQIIMEGKDRKRSLPKQDAPMMDEANRRGFKWELNPTTYWSDQGTMRLYVSTILVPYFMAQKARLGLADDHTAIAQLDVWSVHRSREFRDWIRQTYPWIELHFIPGNLTGLAQACDVGIQRPFKQAIKRAQLADIVSTTLSHLKTHDSEEPAALQLDKTIGHLRRQCVRWFVQAFDAIQNPALIKKAFERSGVPGKWNMSWEYLTSADAIGSLLDVQENEPDFWAELQRPRWSDFADDSDPSPPAASGSAPDESPFAGEPDLEEDEVTDHPSRLVAQLLSSHEHPDSNDPLLHDLADDLDADFEDVDLAPVTRAATVSRRSRKPNTLYSMDDYDYNPDSEGSGAEEEDRPKGKRKRSHAR